MQFNDIICTASLNEKRSWEEVCKAKDMVKRHLVRGYCEQVYYAETAGNAQKVFKLEQHSTKAGEITTKEVYQLPGSSIVAFETDSQNIQDDSASDNVKQSFFILDSAQKIHHIVNEEGIKFQEERVVDFSIHGKQREVDRLQLQDWSHVHIGGRTITFDGETYSFETETSFAMTLPELYFGQKKDEEEKKVEDEDKTNSEFSDDYGDEEEEAE